MRRFVFPLLALATLVVGCDGPAIPAAHTSGELCWTCHGDRYLGTDDPAHEALRFPEDCAPCHGTSSWSPASLSVHPAEGPFPLEGSHRGLECSACHAETTYEGLVASCRECHLGDYRATTSPAHDPLGFPQTCEDCHSTTAWVPASAGVHRTDGTFPLVGGHGGVACSACHMEDDFSGASPECVACHRADYLATTAPDHADSGFPESCADCHTISGWSPATGSAHLLGGIFPLAGGHADLSCSRCHPGGDYASASTACVSCHQADFEATTNPAHGVLGLPTACDTCHVITGWQPATLGTYHTFPLTTGKHRELTCTDCHLPDQLWRDFSCIDCHEHSRARMDDKHLGEVATYEYATSHCYRCHPTGAVEEEP